MATNYNTTANDTTLDFRKGQRKHTILLILIVILGCLWASNPSPQEHRIAIEKDMTTDMGYSNQTAINVRIAETMLTDQNFLFFSITKYNRGGESTLASFGLFGYVFVVLPYDATVNTRMSFTSKFSKGNNM